MARRRRKDSGLKSLRRDMRCNIWAGRTDDCKSRAGRRFPRTPFRRSLTRFLVLGGRGIVLERGTWGPDVFKLVCHGVDDMVPGSEFKIEIKSVQIVNAVRGATAA